MSLAKILEYQSIDTPIYKEQLQLKKSVESQRMTLLKTQYADFTSALAKMDSEAGDLFININNLSDKLNAIVEEERTDFAFNSVTDMSQVDNIGKALADYKEEIATIEKNMNKMFKRLDEISVEMGKLATKCKQNATEQKQLKAVQTEKSQAALANFKDDIVKLAALQKEIDPKWMEKYNELRSKRKMPAFVRYRDGSCEGCGMNIEVELNGKLKDSGDVAECPHCRRIIYIE